MIDDSAGLVTPHAAFRRIVEITHPQKSNLGKEVTSAYWFRGIASDHPDSIACSKALKFLAAKVEEGKIRAQGIRLSSDGPIEINLGELRIGVLRIWEGKLVCPNDGGGGRIYRDVFLSMADLDRELGVPPAAKQKPQPATAPNSGKIDTGRPLKHDWENAIIATMAKLHANGTPEQPKPIADEMRRWFTDIGKTDPADSEINKRAALILKSIKGALKKP
jgi:hypothetical protein